MKKVRRIGILLIALTIIYAIIGINPIMAATTTLSASNVTVNSGASFSVTITSSLKLSGWTISLSNNGGCTFSSVSGGANGMPNGTSIYETNLNGTNTLATYKFKAPTVTKDTKYTISFSATEMDSVDSQNVSNTSCTATITVKANKSTGSSSSSGSTGSSTSSGTTTKPKTPTFKSANKTVYTTGDVNLRSSWSTTSTATLVKKGTELKLTGTSTDVIDGYTWYRVTYNGATKYIASSLITETKPKEEKEEPKDDDENNKSSNKNLASLTIKNVELTPEFDKEITQYTAKIDGDITDLEITGKAEDSKAKVSIEGNTGLKEGDNIVKVKVTAEDETTRTYFITVTKGEENEDNKELKLEQLNIGRVDFGESFKPDTYTYELSLNTYVKNLDITAIPNQEDAKVEIIGNDEFSVGKNMITILLTSADEKQTATYQIEVNLPQEVIEETEEMNSILYYIIAGVAIGLVVIIIISVIIHKRRSKNEDYYEEDDEISSENPEDLSNKLDEEDRVEEKENNKSTEEEPKVTVDDFLNIPEDDEKPKKSKGRHSI